MIENVKRNIYSAKNYEVMALVLSPSIITDNDASVYYLKREHHGIWYDHCKSKHVMGDCIVTMNKTSELIARLYAHDNYNGLSICNYEALAKSIEYLSNVYSDKVVAFSKPNLMGDIGGEWDMILYMLEKIYGVEDLNCLVFE